jgi:hypothetical protein
MPISPTVMATIPPVAGAETTVGSGHDQRTDDQADRPHHQGDDGPASPVARADATGGAGQSQPTDERADQPYHGGR